MEQPIEFECCYCGAGNVAHLDAADYEGDRVVDCEVCCRPLALVIECAGNEVVRVETRPG